MKHIAIIAFTKTGTQLACQLRDALLAQASQVSVAAPERFASEYGVSAYDTLDAWTSEAFETADALLFVSATGIAVRAIAPFIRDKFVDPAVVSIDEKAQFVVPLLSGHVGGANDFAREVAALVGAQSVVSTATDLHGIFAVDEWARKNNLAILDRALAKEISAALLAGKDIGFESSFPIKGELPAELKMGETLGGQTTGCEVPGNETAKNDDPTANEPSHHLMGVVVSLDPSKQPFEHTLRLVPRVVTVGVGCKRGTPGETIEAFINECLTAAHIAPEAVSTLASIDLKADEPGLLETASKHNWTCVFYSAEELAAVPGEFASSAFVEQTTGVDNVCERAACAAGGQLVQPRKSCNGVTVALALDHDALSNLEFPPRIEGEEPSKEQQ